MADTVQLKLEWENSIRRASVSSRETLTGLKEFINSFLGLSGCDLTYRDEEGDLVTVGSDVELKQLLEAAHQEKRVLRFIIVKSSSADATETSSSTHARQADEEEQEEEEDAPQEPEFPFANLARALSEPEAVQRIQATFQSPVITEAVTKFARAYADTRGDAAVAGLVSAQHLPALLGVLAELVTEVPVLKDLQDLFIQQAFGNGGSGCMGGGGRGMPFPFGGGFGGGGGCRPHPHPDHPHPHPHPHPDGHHHHPHPHPHPHPDGHHHHPHPHPHPHHHHHGRHGGGGGCGQGMGMGHFGVFCDGCSSDVQLKQASQRDGNMTHRGFIRGTRHKSQTVHDFDLCDSCKKNTSRFPDSAYGPFTTVEPPQDPRGAKRMWGWQNRRPQQAQQHSWRQPGGAETSSPSTAASSESGASQRPSQPQDWDLMDTVKAVIEKGTQMFAEAGQQNELSEIARAIAESLKESPKTASTTTEKAPEAAAKPADEKAAVEKKEEPKPVGSPKEDLADPFIKWASQLRQLELLGFDKLETYVQFLEQENGDLERVVNRIVRRDM